MSNFSADVLDRLHLVYPNLLTAEPLVRAESLLKATHKISGYSLTLVHGLPLSPLQLKINGNIEDIISQILQNNEKAYLDLDELISTSKEFLIGMGETDVDAGIGYRITRMCVYSALVADDFNSAYNNCMKRLCPFAAEIAKFDKNLLWQVLFASGKYVSPNHSPAVPSPSSSTQSLPIWHLRQTIEHLALQLELLSYAMDICPNKHIFEILTVWQDFELQQVHYMRKFQQQKQQYQMHDQTNSNAASVVKNFLRMF